MDYSLPQILNIIRFLHGALDNILTFKFDNGIFEI